MIKKIITRKVLIASIALFSLMLFSFITNPKDNVLNNIKEELEYVDKEIMKHDIFLFDSNSYVALTEIVVDSKEPASLARELLEVLISGGVAESKIPNGFRSTIPSNTEINNITYNDRVLKIDLSESFLETSKELEEKMLESVIFTLTSIKDVDEILIYINGEILSKLPQTGIILPSSFNREYGINKKFNINSLKDIIGVTVYYINEHNGNYYYVPVTNYVNGSRDKISIIVEELSNNFVYMDNLMSFLNEDTKLVSYEINDNTMTLVFNDAIFNSLEEKDILEEVVYTISLSIGDNYNIKEVLFKVENEEILKKVLNN